ncbi:Os04g0290433 [Oryza sativa Japonica Group]|uniref:Os04g0290433 protein n=1 Tax=Oryza sativa subsp. japonica TaxID=39947 RepID=C7J1M3_ORYSJ|nr:Os04g0290433 [Oryza sativa Japonica Group]|eukprot:NP_001173844.1 Os04g0290433 [Oryza sativa Japonica Group]
MRRRRRGRLELREASASSSPHEINKRRLGARAGVRWRGYAARTADSRSDVVGVRQAAAEFDVASGMQP